jgi:integrase
MARGDTYLKKRGDIYWVRFQYPSALQESACDLYGVDSWPKERARSLGVTTLVEAEAKAAPFIAEHKELLLYHAARNDDANNWANMIYVHLMEPNTQDILSDGTRIVATKETIVTITAEGEISSKPNRRPILEYTEFAAKTPQFQDAFAARQKVKKTEREDIDAEVMEAYIADRVFENFFIPSDDEENERPPYTEEDVKAIRANLGRFTDEQKLMLVWHISSSVRPGGIYSITDDEWEDGEDADTGETFRTRHARIRKDKGKYGPRNLPIPQAVLDLKKDDGTPLLPEKIEGPLFTTQLSMLLVEINNKLKRLKINTPENDKTLYSGRHRARDRLLNRDAPDKMSKAIMGHARKIEQHDRYGTGYAMWKMNSWINKIGF